MKKILLAGCALIASLTMNAQTPGLDAVGGFAYDDFASAPYGDANGGLFWWGDSILNGGSNAGFQAILNRDTLGGKLDVQLTQAYNQFVPFGVGFGDSNGDGTGVAVTADFSANSDYMVSFTNNSDSVINIRVTPQDVNLNEVDTDTAWGLDPANGWKYPIDVTVAAQGTATLMVGSTNSQGAVLSGNYVGASKADWSCPTPPCQLKVIDLSKIKGFNITVTNKNQNAADNFAHWGLANVNLSITSFKIGKEVAVGLSAKTEKLAAEVFPNPANSKVNFSSELTDVVIFNAQGVVVKELASATEINVENFEAGIYFIKSNEGTTSLVVE